LNICGGRLRGAGACEACRSVFSINIDRILDGFVKSPLGPLFVIPAKAGIQSFQAIMDSCLRRNDAIFDFLRFRQYWVLASGL
jgi:hypothetical protein